MRKIILGLFFSVPAFAFTTGVEVTEHTKAVTGEHDVHVHIGRTSGHEEITRQSLLRTAELLSKIGIDPIRGNEKVLGDLSPRSFGTIGSLTPNRIIAGNFCTDSPKNDNAVFSLLEFWQLADDINWHNDPDTQVFHFLRSYKKDGSMVSAKQACIDARSKIQQIAMTGAREYLSGNRENALFLFGHATHIIQDSFSPAHTRREEGASGYALKDVCYYGSEQQARLQGRGIASSACYHETVDLVGDGIWVRTDEQLAKTRKEWGKDEKVSRSLTNYQYTDAMKRTHLKHEARLARDATVKFLYLVATDIAAHRRAGIAYTEAEQQKLAKRIEKEFFDGAAKIDGFKERFPKGVMRCDGLR